VHAHVVDSTAPNLVAKPEVVGNGGQACFTWPAIDSHQDALTQTVQRFYKVMARVWTTTALLLQSGYECFEISGHHAVIAVGVIVVVVVFLINIL